VRASIWLPGMTVRSKQHSSRISDGRGRHMMFRDPAYTALKTELHLRATAALMRAGWTAPTEERVAMRLTYRGRFDLDNAAGFVMDALEGAAYVRDSQIAIMTVAKRPAGEIGLTITVREIGAKKGNRRAND